MTRVIALFRKRALLLLSLSTPCWADGLGANVVHGIATLLLAWLGSPLLGVLLSMLGKQARGCWTLIIAYLVGVLTTTVSLYSLFRLGSSMSSGPLTSFHINALLGGAAGAGATLLVIAGSRSEK